MEKKIISIYSPKSEPGELLVEEQFEQSLNFLTSNESNNLDIKIDDLFDRKKMENRLEKLGYTIPKLLIARESFHPKKLDEEFDLPIQNRDIYEETSYNEFQNILSHLQTNLDDSSEMIRFKINFLAIWDGIR